MRAEELAEVLRNPKESVSLDFKERLNWASAEGRLEAIRDITCLANRDGGRLIVGLHDDGSGQFSRVGLADDDYLPDVSELGVAIRDYIEPPIRCEISPLSLDGLTFGVIEVSAFTTIPHICRKNGGAGPDKQVLRDGAVYVRSDAAQCMTVRAHEMRLIVERAVANTGAAVQAMLPPNAQPSLQSDGEVESGIRVPVAATASSALSHVTCRACDFSPAGAIVTADLRALEDRLQEARLVDRYGQAVFPRFVNLAFREGSPIRTRTGLVVEAERSFGSDRTARSVTEVTRSHVVRVRETLWEDVTLDPDLIDIDGLLSFPMFALEFGRRYYLGLADAFGIAIGITKPLGRRLTSDPSRWIRFSSTYVATSSEDIWVARSASPNALEVPEQRDDVAFSICSELLDYFGYRIGREIFDLHVAKIRAEYRMA